MEIISRGTRMINLDGEYHKYYKVFDLYGRIEMDFENNTAKYTAKNDWDDFSGVWNFSKTIDNGWCFDNEGWVSKSEMEISLQIINMIEELWENE